MTDLELFSVPDHWWVRRRCQVCGGRLFDPRPLTHTYVMQRQGWVKIGASSNPAERRSVLAMPSPGCRVVAPEAMTWEEPIFLLGVIEGGQHEHQLHERFAVQHAAGEWFLPDAVMLGWLDSGVLLTLSEAGLPTKRTKKVTDGL